MEIKKIDRTTVNHGEYYGVIKLNYDEIVMISNALINYLHQTEYESSSKSAKVEALIRDWKMFVNIACHGKPLLNNFIEEQRRIENESRNNN